MEPRWKTIQRIIKESDIVLYILDARIPEYSLSKEIEKMIKEQGRPVIYVINKADLVSRTALEKSLDKLREGGREVVYTALKKTNTIRNLLVKIKKTFSQYGKRPETLKEKYAPKTEVRHREAKADIGLIGLAVMGQNLVLNMDDHGYTVAVYNRTVSKVDEFVNGNAQGTKVIGAHSIEELVGALKRPRRVMLLVKAGKPVDDFIDLLRFHQKYDI